jgi:hypothetical protein
MQYMHSLAELEPISFVWVCILRGISKISKREREQPFKTWTSSLSWKPLASSSSSLDSHRDPCPDDFGNLWDWTLVTKMLACSQNKSYSTTILGGGNERGSCAKLQSLSCAEAHNHRPVSSKGSKGWTVVMFDLRSWSLLDQPMSLPSLLVILISEATWRRRKSISHK